MAETTTITNQYGLKMTVEKFLHSSSAKKRKESNNGLIALCKIDSGRLVLGARVKVNLPENSFEDKIVRIEENHLPVRTADPEQSIGICFEKTSIEQINLFLNQPTARE